MLMMHRLIDDMVQGGDYDKNWTRGVCDKSMLCYQ